MENNNNFFTVYWDDGAHSFELESFTNHKEAIAYMFKEADEWKNGDGWNNEKESNPHLESIVLEVIEQDESGDVFEPHESWDSEQGFSGLNEEEIKTYTNKLKEKN
jgi:hypothetical protein